MNFTKQEKEAINYLLVRLMKVDGHTDINEAAALFHISQIIGININEAEESLAMEYDAAKTIIQSIETKKRELVYQLLNEMAGTDGHFDREELDFIKDVFEKY